MIPLRVSMEGFLSYRERVNLDFDGAPLWILKGPNGAGKSAVFDAITYCLYGQHRAGKQQLEHLIHSGCGGFLVEFEFALGEDVYCIRRTRRANGSATCDLRHLRGPHAPQPGRPGPQSVPEMDNKRKLEEWVQHHLGLDFNTFRAAVLLQQGQADALLVMDPVDRHERLTQLIDLSAYKDLADRADRHAKTHASQVAAWSHELEGIPDTDPEEIAGLQARIEEWEGEVAGLSERRRRLAAWKVQAGQWAALTRERAELQKAAEESDRLLKREAEIRQRAARQRDLDAVLPALKGLLDAQVRLTQRQVALETARETLAECTSALQPLQTAATQAGDRLKELEEDRSRLEAQEREALARLDELAPDRSRLEELDRLDEEDLDAQGRLASLPSDLDTRLVQVRAMYEAAKAAKQALPWLHQVSKARGSYRQAEAAIRECDETLAGLRSAVDLQTGRASEAQAHLGEAEDRARKARDVWSAAKARLEQCQGDFERFGQVAGADRCHYCGQALTEEHLDQERARLEAARDEAEQSLAQAAERKTEAEELLKAAKTALAECEKEAEGLRSRVTSTEVSRSRAVDRQNGAWEQAGEARAVLADSPFGKRLWPPECEDAAECFACDFPTDEDLQALKRTADDLDTAEKELRALDGQFGQRQALLAQQQAREARRAEIHQELPPERVAEVRRQLKEARQQRDAAQRGLEDLTDPLEAAQEVWEAAEEDLMQARERHQTAEKATNDAGLKAEADRRDVERRLRELPGDWQEAGAGLTSESLSGWEVEAASLARAAEELYELENAGTRRQTAQARLSAIETELGTIPPEARKPVEDLESQDQEAADQADTLDAQLRAARSERRRQEDWQERREDLCRRVEDGKRQAYLYRTLAGLLGRDSLQRALLQQAESEIVSQANEVLDRISGGNLRLELRQSLQSPEDAETGTRTVRALDLVAYNLETGETPLPVAFLSGSQRFRVAVSLALGIGRYAGQGSRNLQSVILDEGFGSLDEQGRQQIIGELQRLGDELDRIILVSHQDEFSQAFSNGYSISLEDGASRARQLGSVA